MPQDGSHIGNSLFPSVMLVKKPPGLPQTVGRFSEKKIARYV